MSYRVLELNWSGSEKLLYGWDVKTASIWYRISMNGEYVVEVVQYDVFSHVLDTHVAKMPEDMWEGHSQLPINRLEQEIEGQYGLFYYTIEIKAEGRKPTQTEFFMHRVYNTD